MAVSIEVALVGNSMSTRLREMNIRSYRRHCLLMMINDIVCLASSMRPLMSVLGSDQDRSNL